MEPLFSAFYDAYRVCEVRLPGDTFLGRLPVLPSQIGDHEQYRHRAENSHDENVRERLVRLVLQ
jgi:hypothetical protein